MPSLTIYFFLIRAVQLDPSCAPALHLLALTLTTKHEWACASWAYCFYFLFFFCISFSYTCIAELSYIYIMAELDTPSVNVYFNTCCPSLHSDIVTLWFCWSKLLQWDPAQILFFQLPGARVFLVRWWPYPNKEYMPIITPSFFCFLFSANVVKMISPVFSPWEWRCCRSSYRHPLYLS